jgi:hypothetical protein
MPVTEVINENSAVLPLGGQLRLLRGVATAGLESGESIELDIGTVVFVEKETFSYQMLDGKKVELSVVQVVDVAPLAEFEGLKSRLREWKRFGRAFFVKAVGNSVHVITARGKYGATIDTSAEDKEWVRAFVGPRGK